MSCLNKDADAEDESFKFTASLCQDYTSWHSQPVPLNSSPASTSGFTPDLPVTKKKRPKTNIVYSNQRTQQLAPMLSPRLSMQ
ncbi:hypothetical protein M405DRAFT_819468 [Rhizopogon salebrosus TDB-379]|nr:hypothetical protein M405DRAFT_819468 [Rhizopogon salebrosus TDB-379]